MYKRLNKLLILVHFEFRLHDYDLDIFYDILNKFYWMIIIYTYIFQECECKYALIRSKIPIKLTIY
jgi:hypothetical protein